MLWCCIDGVISCFSQNHFCLAGKLQLVTMEAAGLLQSILSSLLCETLVSLSFNAKGVSPQRGLSRALLVFRVLNVTRSKSTHLSACVFVLNRGKVSESALLKAQQEQPVVEGSWAEQETSFLIPKDPRNKWCTPFERGRGSQYGSHKKRETMVWLLGFPNFSLVCFSLVW